MINVKNIATKIRIMQVFANRQLQILKIMQIIDLTIKAIENNELQFSLCCSNIMYYNIQRLVHRLLTCHNF